MKKLKKVILIILAILAISQFFGPEQNLGDVQSFTAFYDDTKPSDQVKEILETACFDCHSNVSEYPWYSNITPINYWMDHHIEEGSMHFNISEWEQYSLKKRDHKMEEVMETVESKEMPLNSYTWTHKEAILSNDQINLMSDWVKDVRLDYSNR